MREKTLPMVESTKIYLLDVRNYTWVDGFKPNETLSNTTPDRTTTSSVTIVITQPAHANDGRQLNTIIIAVSTIGGILGIIIFVTIGIFGYKWYQKRNKIEIMRIDGNTLNS